MGTSGHGREKIVEKLLKEWEHTEDEVLIREVATKGTHIHILQQFLSRRSGKTLIDTKYYFNDEVDNYVHRLLKNGQIYKAELVLKNVGRNVHTIFYAFLYDTPQTLIEEDIKKHISEYLQISVDQYDVTRDEFDYYLLTLKLAAINKKIRRQFEDEMHKFTLEHLFDKNIEFRRLMATTVCFYCKNTILIGGLDKETTWNYLWKSGQFIYVANWLYTIYENVNIADSIKSATTTQNMSFDMVLGSLFATWNIDCTMFASIQPHPKLDDYLLNCFARIGMICNRDKSAINIIFHRVLATQSLLNIRNFFYSEHSLDQFLRFIFQYRQLFLLSIFKIFDVQLISKLHSVSDDLANEIQLCTIIKSINVSQHRLLGEISQSCSNYITSKADPEFHQKLPHIFIFEHLLFETAIQQTSLLYRRANLSSKLPVLDMFFQKLCKGNILADSHITLPRMLEMRKIYMDLLRKQPAISDSVDDIQTKRIKFTNDDFCQNMGPINYMSYVHQRRGTYAVYRFITDQLAIYSQISLAQIQSACGVISEQAINYLDDKELAAHFVAFIEMFGIDSCAIRAHIICYHAIKSENNGEANIRYSFKNEFFFPEIELILLRKIQIANNALDLFRIDSIEALRVLYQAKHMNLPVSFVKMIAAKCDWFRFLLSAAYNSMSIPLIVDVCQMDSFVNSNIGLNIGRALKGMISEEGMLKRKNIFPYRQLKRKMLNTSDSSNMLTSLIYTSTSNDFGERAVQSASGDSHLNMKDNQDMTALILISACETRLFVEVPFTLCLLEECFKSTPDGYQTFEILKLAIIMRWPALAVLAVTTNVEHIDCCWIVWLVISIDLLLIPNTIATLPELCQHLIMYSVENNYIQDLNRSFEIFYPSCRFKQLTNLLCEIRQNCYSVDASRLLIHFMDVLREGPLPINHLIHWTIDNFIIFVNTLIFSYAKIGNNSGEHLQKLLDTICASGLNAFDDFADFDTLVAVNRIVRFNGVRLDFDAFLPPTEKKEGVVVSSEYIRLIDKLIANMHFNSAIKLAHLINSSKDQILYGQWVNQYRTYQQIDLGLCERYIIENSISPLILIKFLIYVADQLDYSDLCRYEILLKAMNMIKKNHVSRLDGIHCDRIEYEMYKCLLKYDHCINKIELFHSNYYDTIMQNDRRILFKTLVELKELAGTNRLTVLATDEMRYTEFERLDLLINCLVDQGDIVQALRLQGIFNHSTADLQYLVFCMAICENLASLQDLSIDLEQMLNDDLKYSVSSFHKRRLQLLSKPPCDTSAPFLPNNRVSNMDLAYRSLQFECNMYVNKQDILETIQRLASRVKHGFAMAQRIVLVYQTAMYVNKDYSDMLQSRNARTLLKSVETEQCNNRLLIISDIMTSMQMTNSEIANFIAEQISQSIIKSCFYLLHGSIHSFGRSYLWDYDLDKDFHLILDLSRDTSLLGHKLLKYIDALKIYRQLESTPNVQPSVSQHCIQHNEDVEISEILVKLRAIMENQVLSQKKQNNITVDLLIKAHDCFVHECSMEGIAFVLQRTKVLNSTLAAAKSWRIIVKLLIGIGRYRDMYYCLETLFTSDQFESLLGQFDDQSLGLKEAIISYLREYHPDDNENYRLTALHFQMFHELAQISENGANQALDTIFNLSRIVPKDICRTLISSKTSSSTPSESNVDILHFNGDIDEAITSGVSFLRCSKTLLKSLKIAMESYAHAAENYLLDTKLSRAHYTATMAELIAMQIHLVSNAIDNNKVNCLCVLDIQNENTFRFLINNELNIPQSLILSRAYPFEIIWTEAIFNQFVVQGKDYYIIEYCVRMELTDSMVEHLVKSFQSQSNITPKMETAISIIVQTTQSVILRYRLASLLSDKGIIARLINGDCLYFLKDSNYGCNEIL